MMQLNKNQPGLKKQLGLAALAATFVAANVWFYQLTPAPDVFAHQPKTALETAGEACDAVAEKSVANLTAVVEFQKLEIFGRKINVMRRCMKDHGYMENPAWVSYATPLAKRDALQQQLSEDEALENLKRKAMYVFKAADKAPLYWQHIN